VRIARLVTSLLLDGHRAYAKLAACHRPDYLYADGKRESTAERALITKQDTALSLLEEMMEDSMPAVLRTEAMPLHEQLTASKLRLVKLKGKRPHGAGASHRGRVRVNNEDVIIAEPDIGLYAVLDGMGGAAAGEVAARLAGAKIAEFVRAHPAAAEFKTRELLELALDEAAVAVFTAARNNADFIGMGTTAVAFLAVDSTRFVIGHAGDSRAYRLRRGHLQALTRDHTIAQEYVNAGRMKAEDLDESPLRNILTRNLGEQLGVLPEMLESQFEPGDRLLLCSDGLYSEVPAALIGRALDARDPPEQVAGKLLDLALERGARDNVSVVVIDG
jgi:protein phosphatase